MLFPLGVTVRLWSLTVPWGPNRFWLVLRCHTKRRCSRALPVRLMSHMWVCPTRVWTSVWFFRCLLTWGWGPTKFGSPSLWVAFAWFTYTSDHLHFGSSTLPAPHVQEVSRFARKNLCVLILPYPYFLLVHPPSPPFMVDSFKWVLMNYFYPPLRSNI